MSKAYSNKALPAGTILREWRLEEVLGVGGFGIVYKGRGIYFGELVAIKEYFPSSIAERDAEATVVPIGSDVEEVHALGLKKFVEEAKLLWNLSTPSRHPNIVSVRSLFEIHGTAYMVMDFEDGVSLSKLLREGRRFNERSLWNIIQPIAEGLDRAHRVGVLHRDIKPPNILIADDNRPVLIDFGSARFEAAEATSTSVTFHTPPYAAVEQYVKTYPQGPWTDIYAMSVVLYECVTGEKPPEVLERLHGGLGTPLAEGHWPGFGKRFLQAIDAGMTIRPSERPQSIREWLALFGKKNVVEDAGDEDAPTRFFAHEVSTEEIVPVPPPAPGFDQEALETGVPKDPTDAQFKRAGEETGASKKNRKGAAAAEDEAVAAEAEQPAAPPVEAKAETAKPEVAPKPEPPKTAEKPAALVRKPATDASKPWYKEPRAAMLAGGGALALIVGVVAATSMFGGGSDEAVENIAIPDSSGSQVAVLDVTALAAAERLFAEDARKAGAPEEAVKGLVAAGEQLDKQMVGLQPLLNDPAQESQATARADEMKRVASTANAAFANALLQDVEGKANRALAGVPATDPSVGRLNEALSGLRASAQAASTAPDPGRSLAAARDALAKSLAVSAVLPDVSRAQQAARKTAAPTTTQQAKVQTPTGTVTTTTTTAAPTAAAPTSSTASSSGSSAAKVAQLNSIVSSGRSLARQVIASGNKENVRLAKNYDKYLATLENSGRGTRTSAELDQLIKQANQTKAYLVFLNKPSQ